MKTKVTETSVDRYRWPLVAGIVSLVIAFLCGIVRRYRGGTLPGTAPAAAVFIAFLASPPDAAAQGELLPPPNIQGEAAVEPSAPPPTRPEKPSLRATPPSDSLPLDGKSGTAQKPLPKKSAAKPARPAGVSAAVEKEALEPAPEKGDPWQFYDTGDWRSAVYNFDREIEAALVLKARPEELERLHMARGAAAFKGASRRTDKFDNHMINQAIESFGTALASTDATVRESAHYNLANAIYERTKAAEKLRAENYAKAVEKKSKKNKKRFNVTIPYLDKTIRLLENSVEHYQETLLLNENHAPAKANYAAVTDLIKKLRDIRLKKANQGKGEPSEGAGEGEGECEGECEGEGSGKGKGKGKGSGNGDPSESEEGDEGEEEEMGEGEEEEGEGENGEEPGKGKGEGEGEEGGDHTNEEFEGKVGTEGDTGEEAGGEEPGGEKEGGGDKEGDKGADPGFGGGSEETARRLRNLSQEIRDRIRPRNQPKERRPLKDW